MGHGSYQSTDWEKLKAARNINDGSTVQDLYRSRGMKDYLNPHGVKYRESCDSMDNPASTAIIFGLDVTGSMGYLSENIAKGALNRTMLEIYEKKPVTNPHIMFQAIGDSKSDAAPLQTTQFEADIRIAEQLLDVYFEGRGGGNGGESYLLSWYFADKHTKIDCYENRKEKGFLFTIGDECCHKKLTRAEIARVFGDSDIDRSAEELYQKASEKYEIFHIVMKAGSYKYQHSGEDWKKLIGNRAVELEPEDLDVLPEIFVSLMQAARGMDAAQITAQWQGKAADVVTRILAEIGPLTEPEKRSGSYYSDMKEIKIVIGKNFGDEGKGAAVYRLCRGKHALVVRHNGGAQAGHTVEDGSFRFVFHQLGSGSSLGCPTYWSHTFLPDLLKLGDEAAELKRKLAESDTENLQRKLAGTDAAKQQMRMTGTDVAKQQTRMTETDAVGDRIKVYAHRDCICTTVYDVLLNSLTEQLRGSSKHGSCGMGIFETVCRSSEERFCLHLSDFVGATAEQIAERLRFIRDEYVYTRIAELREAYPEAIDGAKAGEWLSLIRNDNLLYNAADTMCDNFKQYVTLADWEEISRQYQTIVFENAQGLMLDEDNLEYYPHLTPSHTGLTNVAVPVKEAEKNTSVEVVYVTRTYVTRHGVGRLDYECTKEDIGSYITDATNVPNPWQDSMRYAYHPQEEVFFKYINRDLEQLKGLSLSVQVSLYLTHLDETAGKVLFADGEKSLAEFIKFCEGKGVQVVPIYR